MPQPNVGRPPLLHAYLLLTGGSGYGNGPPGKLPTP